MAAGFQSWNDNNGIYQVDGDTVNLQFRRKVNIGLAQSGQIVYGEVGLNTSTEIVAFRSSAPVTVNGVQNDRVQIFSVAGQAQATVECFIFGPPSFTGSSFGRQVFNSQGILIFDALQRPLQIVGMREGEGDFLYNGARQYAAIPLTHYVQNSSQVIGAQPALSRHDFQRAGCVSAIGGGIRVQNQVTYSQLWNNYQPGGPGSQVPGINNTFGTNRTLIIDVTGS